MSSINVGQLISNVDAVGSSSIIYLRGHVGKLVKRKLISPADTSLLIAVKSDLLEETMMKQYLLVDSNAFWGELSKN